jgi:ectoine hydroxylase
MQLKIKHIKEPAMSTSPLTNDQISQFNDDGYVMFQSLLDQEEVNLILGAAKDDKALSEHAFSADDTSGRKTRLSLWNHPGDDIYGTLSRSEKMVDACEQLMQDEVYHYHSKMMLKEPRIGGAWEWHQDYGYWYQNHCLYPDMISVLIALDPMNKANGCLEVLKGSHNLGRFEHGTYGKQTGADPERVAAARERLEHLYVEMNPGDALFFHGNTLHASAANESANSRWSVICCYNTKHNNPYKEAHHPNYTPLSKLPHAAIKEMGMKVSSDTQKSWLDPAADATVNTDDYDSKDS